MIAPPPSTPPPFTSCYLPHWLAERRGWGISLQLYELRSMRNWGIGDFADLAEFAGIAAARGADFVGLNPLHALFLAAPEMCSPFSPSNRRFLNPLYIAVDRLDGFDADTVDQARLAELRAGDLVDYRGVMETKLQALRYIWKQGTARGPDEADQLLRRHAVFEALSLHMAEAGYGAGWLSWPEEYRDPDSAAVKAFADSHVGDIAFHVWLQQVARQQLSEAATRAKDAGMRVGLYLDFAVGDAPDGSGTWSGKDASVRGVSVGAPPDVFTAAGQDWGLAPLSPEGIARNNFADYRGLMASALRHAGALRIDHAMSLRQLFWIPAGGRPSHGRHVQYPMEGMIETLASLSHEHEAVVIGEDLGHVPPGFRETMAAAGILSYRILYFEKHRQRFISPSHWPLLAIACLSTHDLPTLKGWWAGDDIRLRLEYDLIDRASARHQSRERASEKRSLLAALGANGLLSAVARRKLARANLLDEAAFASLSVAVHRYIARTPARLACMRLADSVGERQPTNLPGTSKEYPNWQRKLDLPLEKFAGSPLFLLLTQAMAGERPA